MDQVIEILRERLITLMENRGLTNYEVADSAGIHHVTVSKILNNKMPQVSLDLVYKLAIGLEVTLDDLVGSKELYPEHDKKILEIREQFEKYGYDSADAIIKMIPEVSRQIQDAKRIQPESVPEPKRRFEEMAQQLAEKRKQKKKKSA